MTTIELFRERLIKEIYEHQAIINKHSLTKEECDKQADLYREELKSLGGLYDEGPTDEEAIKACYDSLSKYKLALDIYHSYVVIDNLNETLASDLVHVPTRYLVTDDDSLQSPAGANLSDRIFKAGQINLCVDDLASVPRSNVELKAYDIDKLVIKHGPN